MSNILYTIAKTDAELYGFLQLQRANLPVSISHEEALEEGFVTVEHDFALLKQMNSPYPHIIAKHDEQVIGYTLVMLRELREQIPVLIPMFVQIDAIEFDGNLLKDSGYVVMGQVCIAKGYRGQGIFQGLYQEMANQLEPHFEYIITEVSKRNPRSIRAHEKVGFLNVREYTSDDGEEWVILLLNVSYLMFNV
jgi:ribosomal protein S18 acetylase RimI-like enzyme